MIITIDEGISVDLSSVPSQPSTDVHLAIQGDIVSMTVQTVNPSVVDLLSHGELNTCSVIEALDAIWVGGLYISTRRNNAHIIVVHADLVCATSRHHRTARRDALGGFRIAGGEVRSRLRQLV